MPTLASIADFLVSWFLLAAICALAIARSIRRAERISTYSADSEPTPLSDYREAHQ
jgi:hypothetical protein